MIVIVNGWLKSTIEVIIEFDELQTNPATILLSDSNILVTMMSLELENSISDKDIILLSELNIF